MTTSDSSPSTDALKEEIERARDAVKAARQAFLDCNCGVCYGRLILAKRQLARITGRHR